MKVLNVSWRRVPNVLDVEPEGELSFEWEEECRSGIVFGRCGFLPWMRGKFGWGMEWSEEEGRVVYTLDLSLARSEWRAQNVGDNDGERKGSLALEEESLSDPLDGVVVVGTVVTEARWQYSAGRRQRLMDIRLKSNWEVQTREALPSARVSTKESWVGPGNMSAESIELIQDPLQAMLALWGGNWDSRLKISVGSFCQQTSSQLSVTLRRNRMPIEDSEVSQSRSWSDMVEPWADKMNIATLISSRGPHLAVSLERAPLTTGRDLMTRWESLPVHMQTFLLQVGVFASSFDDDAIRSVQTSLVSNEVDDVKDLLTRMQFLKFSREEKRWSLNPITKLHLDRVRREHSVDLAGAERRMVEFFHERLKQLARLSWGANNGQEYVPVYSGFSTDRDNFLFVFHMAFLEAERTGRIDLYEDLCVSSAYMFRYLVDPFTRRSIYGQWEQLKTSLGSQAVSPVPHNDLWTLVAQGTQSTSQAVRRKSFNSGPAISKEDLRTELVFSLAKAHLDCMEVDRAVDLFRGLELFYSRSGMDQTVQQAQVKYALARAYHSVGNYEQSIETQLEGLKIREDLNLTGQHGFLQALSFFASSLYEAHKFEYSQVVAERAMKMLEDFGLENSPEYVLVLGTLGELARERGDYDGAIQCFRVALTSLGSGYDIFFHIFPHLRGLILQGLAFTLEQIGNYMQSLQAYEDALWCLERIGFGNLTLARHAAEGRLRCEQRLARISPEPVKEDEPAHF